MRWRSLLLAVAVAAAGCTFGDEPSATETPARLPGGATLPACDPGAPAPEQTVAFVANGRAWALDPDGGEPTCLFDVTEPGPFLWGPLADRVLLDDLEVKATPGAPGRAGGEPNAGVAAWGHPTGKSIVYVSEDRTSLLKVHPSPVEPEDVTPLTGSEYRSVTYHPSGLAIAFGVDRNGSQSIWMSTNTGHEARRLVFSTSGSRFGPVAFRRDGRTLLYGATTGDGAPGLYAVNLRTPDSFTPKWIGESPVEVLDIRPGFGPGSIAFTVGGGGGTPACENSLALVATPDLAGRPALPGDDLPTRALGWLGPGRLLVAVGGCDEPFDLVIVDTTADTSTSVVFDVTAAAVRLAAPTPPPELPQEVDLPNGAGVA